MYQRLYYLRGFESFTVDLAEEPPQFRRLIDMALEFNMKGVAKMGMVQSPEDGVTLLRLPGTALRPHKSFVYKKLGQICRSCWRRRTVTLV
jgi:hypothetical protein